MSFKCKIGVHSWDGCQCTRCGKIRDEKHDLSTDCAKCSRCGQIFDENQHDWSEDCDKCATCGQTRENQHSWWKDCEKCSKCGKVRSDMHRFQDGICQGLAQLTGGYVGQFRHKEYTLLSEVLGQEGMEVLKAPPYVAPPDVHPLCVDT